MMAKKSRGNAQARDWSSVALTPIEASDAEILFTWQNTPHIRDLTMGFRFPVQREAVKDWIKRTQEKNAKSQVIFAIRHTDIFVGTVQLLAIDHYQRKCSLGIYVGNTDKRNAGIGYMACCLALDYAFHGLDFRKVGLEVLAKNAKAVRLFESLGFVKEGQKRKEYFLDGKYLDTCLYGLLKGDWQVELPAPANRLIHSID